MKQLVFIHGGTPYDSYGEYLNSLKQTEYDPERDNRKRWKDSLRERLGAQWSILAPVMPSKYNAKYLEWKIWFSKVVSFIEEDAFLVGHSLGGIFLAKYLAENTFPKKIGATFLIAAPYDAEGADYSLDDFELPQNLSLLSEQAGTLFLYYSTNDETVPIGNLRKYEEQLPLAKVRLFEDKGHFNQEEFPELIEEIVNLGL